MDKKFVPAEGSALLSGNTAAKTFQGHVTAACFSPNLDRSICLALLKNGQSRMGETVTISGLQGTVEAEVTRPVFIDPKGVRMKS
jgi:sarcosine oxidase subunit alpha